MYFSRLFMAIAVFLAAPGQASAQVNGFDPHDGCYKLLSQGTDADKLMIAAWTFGYLAAAQDDARPVDMANATTVLGNLADACISNSQASLLDIVSASRKADTSGPGGEDEARALLERFLAPDADFTALTAMLEPTPDDIRTVFREPLATRLIAIYEAAFASGIPVQPKPGQDTVILVRTLTDNLIAGDAVTGDFPGGYGDVVSYLNPGIPIVTFKFVASGSRDGLSVDGLVHVNGRWLLMPKPWRGLQ